MTSDTSYDFSLTIDNIMHHVIRAYAAAQALRADGYLVSEIAGRVYRQLPIVQGSAAAVESAESFANMVTTQWAALESILRLTDDSVRGKSHDEVLAATMDTMAAFVAREGGRPGEPEPKAETTKPSSVVTAIDKLFAEMESPFPNQAPAAKCVVILKCGKELQGSLSKHEGGLRMMMPIAGAISPRGEGKVTMMELWFDYDDVAVVAVERDVVAAGPRIAI